jgi:hypothetical protein
MSDDVWDGSDEAGERLEWLAEPVELLRYDPVDDDPCAVRIFFDLVGDHAPGSSLSDVRTSEARDRVVVAVIRRNLVGVRPDGDAYGTKLVSCLAGVQIILSTALGDRQLIDESTGRVVRPLERAPVVDPEYGDLDDHLGELARTEGCPLWR